MEKFSVKKPFTVLVAVIMVLMLGFVSISNMQTNLLPDVNTPYLMVVTVYPGASPERVESEVSDVMQNALGTVAGVEKVTATSAENYSLLLMQFSDDTDMNSAMVKVSNKVDQTTASLPSSCLTPSIIEYSLNMNAFMTAAVSREGSDVYDLSEFVSDTLVPYVERKGGVSSVSANGLIEKMVQVQLSQEKIDAINEKLLEVIDVQLADARKQLESAEAQIEAGRKEYDRQFKNYNKTVSDTVMQQFSGQVGEAVETVRKQAQALLDSVNQLIAVVQEPEIQQALIDVRDGLQRVMDKFNETGMKDIDSLIEIVAELRDITDKLTGALQQLQQRLNTESGTEGSTAADLADDLQVQQSLNTIYNTLNDVIKAMDDVPGLMSTFSDALGTYSQQQMQAYMKFTEAREMLNEYEKQLAEAKQTYADAEEKAMASSDVSKLLDIDTLAQLIYAQNFSMPAGYVKDSSGKSWLLKVGEEYDSIEDISGALLLHVDGFGDTNDYRCGFWLPVHIPRLGKSNDWYGHPYTAATAKGPISPGHGPYERESSKEHPALCLGSLRREMFPWHNRKDSVKKGNCVPLDMDSRYWPWSLRFHPVRGSENAQNNAPSASLALEKISLRIPLHGTGPHCGGFHPASSLRLKKC